MSEVASAANLIAILGGHRKVAELLGVSESWISNCSTAGVFPQKHRRALQRALPDGYELPERLFHRAYWRRSETDEKGL